MITIAAPAEASGNAPSNDEWTEVTVMVMPAAANDVDLYVDANDGTERTLQLTLTHDEAKQLRDRLSEVIRSAR